MKNLSTWACCAILLLSACKKEKIQPDFSLTKSNYYLNEPVLFDNKSVNASSYTWDFGDGTTSSETSPIHNYTKGGVFQVKLSAGDKNIVKSVRIYPGTSSYQVVNQTTSSVPLASFGLDAGNNLQDFKDHGTMIPNAKSDTAYTIYTQVGIGGYIGSKAFIAIQPYTMTKFGHSTIAINNNTQIYMGTSVQATAISVKNKVPQAAKSIADVITDSK
ncbi:PKD domain-containing protein [Mucilaginibacter aquatilis]|uniref:PKD domain-containing protein n=1 Tax=Mucilaginibacter aquatilis TaxID=1517760 RepID=A0A6I4IFQ6_9SPHI|nr:PKD domain-containing protein [Mucilaginibacter aquatilis]MVN92376.1 PKD domain-containing protein [Mucilaginibacter aquatilis]